VSSFLVFFTAVMVIIDVAFYILTLNAQLGLKDSVKVLNVQLDLKSSVKKIVIPLYGVFVVFFIMIYNYYTNNHSSSILVSIAMLIVYSAIFIKGKWIFKLFWVGFPIVLLFAAEISALSAVLTFQLNVLASDSTSFGLYYYIAAGISKVLLMGLLYLLMRVKLNLEQFGYHILVMLAATPMLSISFMIPMWENILDGSDPVFPFRASLILLAINLIIVWLIIIINKKNAQILEFELQSLEKSLKQELRIKNYEQLLATHDKFKGYQGHVDKIMTALWGVLRDDYGLKERAERIESYKEILGKITQLRQNSNLMFCTDDEILNMVLSSKDDLAKKKGIIIEPEIMLDVELSYDSGIIGSILMIVLDNAIETVNSIDDIEGEKIINLSLKIEDRACEIIIENPADRMIEIIKTMEHQDASLRMAGELAARCCGSLDTSCEDYYITTTIKIPLPISDFKVQPADVLC